MAGLTEKLYPPTISGTLPAFFKDGAVVKITVPFSMNRAVNTNEIYGFSLKIKNIQGNKLLGIISTLETNDKQVSFELNEQDSEDRKILNNMKVGEFFKVQLAYLDDRYLPGYYSTVGIIKYTSKPTVYIEGLENSTRIRPFLSSYTGVYKTGEDKSERPYSYNFSLLDENGDLVETSGWLLHNSNIKTDSSESLSLETTTDIYTFKNEINTDKIHQLSYKVRTINNLEISSPLYQCFEPGIESSGFELQLKANNNFDDGYININLALNQDRYLNIEDLPSEEFISNEYTQLVPEGICYPVFWSGYSTTSCYKIVNSQNKIKYLIDITRNNGYDKEIIAYDIYDGGAEGCEDNSDKNNLIPHMTLIRTISIIEELEQPISIRLYRAEKTNNYQSWKMMQTILISSYDFAINNWNFKDFTVEQGITYKYCFRQYNAAGVEANRVISNEVFCDFEDMFLWDGNKQLKIRFNPKVASFKTTLLEQKTDTIGSRYPFFFRNGNVEYKEFSITGLISYLMDDNELFLNYEDDLELASSNSSKRSSTPVNQKIDDIRLGKSWENSITQNLTAYNVKAERKFKLKVLDWLNNGEIKLFRSPTEGNYLVRLLNISLSPEDQLSRMLHTFSCTAYEVEECNYYNLTSLGFLTPEDLIKSKILIKTIKIKDYLNQQYIENESALIKLNQKVIYELVKIHKSNNSTGQKLYIRIGQNEKVELYDNLFTLQVNNETLPDIYFCLNDYIEYFEETDNTLEKKINRVKSIIGDTIITYQYDDTNIITAGELNNIYDVYLEYTAESYLGTSSNSAKQFSSSSTTVVENNTTYRCDKEIVKFLFFNIRKKEEINIKKEGNQYLTMDGTPINSFIKTAIYKVYSDDNLTTLIEVITNDEVFSGNALNNIINNGELITNIVLTTNEGEIYNFTEVPPAISLNQNVYTSIRTSINVYIDYAYLSKITKYYQN